MSSRNLTTASTVTYPQIQGFLNSIRLLTKGLSQGLAVEVLSDEIERRVHDVVTLYERQCEMSDALREDCKARNDEQIALRKRLCALIEPVLEPTAQALADKLLDELRQ